MFQNMDMYKEIQMTDTPNLMDTKQKGRTKDQRITGYKELTN